MRTPKNDRHGRPAPREGLAGPAILEDGRGLWCRFEASEAYYDAGKGIRLRAQTWNGLVFKPTGEVYQGAAVYRCNQAAIGALHVPLSPTVTPAGWHQPRGTA